MTYEQLRVLDAIITTGSFRAASESLFRSQPSVSVAIKKLEEEFEIKLFSRDHYRPVLTSEGRAFYKKAKTVLNQTDNLELFGKQLSVGDETEILISIDAIAPLPFILEMLKKYEKDYPMTELEMSVEYMGGSIEKVLDKTADIGIVPIEEEHPKLEMIPLTVICMIPVAAPSFPPAQANREMTALEMQEYVQVIVKSSGRHSIPKEHGVLEGGRNWTVRDFFTKKQIILAGLGWGRLPHHLVEDELETGSLVHLDVQTVKKTRIEVLVVRRCDKPIGPVANQLWEDFKQLSKQQGF